MASTSDPDVVFESAGTHAVPGSPATANMVSIGAELGVDLEPHRSRSFVDVDEPDLVLCMEQEHLSAVRVAFPNLSSEAIRLLDSAPVVDPYGEDLDTYRACAAQIAQAIERLEI